MNLRPFRISVGMGIAALLFSMGCGGSGSSSSSKTTPTAPAAASMGNVNVLVSDDATEDWATIGVKVLGISLVPQGGGSPVVVFTAPSPTPVINLVQLDQLGEILGNAAVPVGTYTSAKLTLSANPGDISLVYSADPEVGFGFGLGGGTTVPSSNIQIKGASGSTGSLTVPLTITLVQPLTVTANSSNALDLEFDLKHPAFIVQHGTANAPIWAINFNGPVRHHPRHDLTRLVLRHPLGQVSAVSTDNTAITITKDYATYPVPISGQVPIASGISLSVLADATNGTRFYDVDTPANNATIRDFSKVGAALLNNGAGKYVRIAARYQANGVLVAVRIWASTNFQKVWFSPEGHVTHVNTTTKVMTVSNENGLPVPITIGQNTQFFFRTPQNALADTTPIGIGTSFFDGNSNGLPNLARGFKVHVSAVDPLASPLTADTVDIEIPRYDGTISGANTNSFIYTHTFATPMDSYTGTLPFIASSTANGTDSDGNAITGFDWWYFTFPTQADTGSRAVTEFVSINSVTQQRLWGVTYSSWGDGTTTNLTDWYAKFAVIEPTALPRGTVSSPFAPIANGESFGMTAGMPVTVDLSTVSGSASLVYQVDNTKGIVNVTQEDLTTPAGLNVVQQALVNGVPVKAYGVPASNGAIAAYVLFYYTGAAPQ